MTAPQESPSDDPRAPGRVPARPLKMLWRGHRWSPPRALAALALLVGALAVPAVRYRLSEAWASALWGLALLGAFVGWGGLVNEWLRPGRRRGWGLDGAVGAAAYLWIGGALAIVHGISKPAVWIFVLLGLVALGLPSRSAGLAPVAVARRPRFGAGYAVVLGVLVVLALFRYAESVSNAGFNVWDDNMAYTQFATKLIETGSLYEPFSSRRMASLGGQTMLDAALLAGAPPVRLHVVDSGICMLLVLGLALGYSKSSSRRAAGLLAAVLFFAIPDPRHNIGSEMSGVLFFFALFRVLDDDRADAGRPDGQSAVQSWGQAIILGLLGAAVCTLRQSYLPSAGATVAVYFLLRLRSPAERPALLRQMARVGAATFVALLPWMLTSFANARTFLYPLMTGNTNPGWGLLGKVNGWEEDRWFLINTFYFEPVRTIVFFVLAGCLLRATRRTDAIRAQLFGALIGFALLVHSFQASIYYDSIERYYFAFLVAYVLAVTLFTTRGKLTRLGRALPAVLVVIALVLHIYESRENLLKTYTGWVTGAEQWRTTRNPDRGRAVDASRALYARVQNAVPRGARMVVMVDYPYLFDFRRNDILNFDQPGAVSPQPHVPYFKGPEALVPYFRQLGLRYLVFNIGNSSPEYNYSTWKNRLAENIAPGARGGMYKSIARFYLDIFDNFLALTESRKVLLHEGELWVLDLGTRR